jgi:hypothetical protein
MTIMEKNAAEYGIEGFQLDTPLEYDTVETTAPTSLTLVADILDMPVPELAALNPASLRGMIPEEYPLHVPKGSGNQLVAAMQTIPANHLDAWRMHRVGPGETLAAVGKRYNVTSASIAAVNHLESSQAQEGDRLLIPTAARIESPAASRAGARTATRTPIRTAAKPGTKTTTVATHRKPAARRKPTTTAAVRPVRKPPVTVAHNSGN